MRDRPVGEHRMTGHARGVDCAEIARILRIGSIVAHDPKVALGHGIGIAYGNGRLLEWLGNLVLGVGEPSSTTPSTTTLPFCRSTVWPPVAMTRLISVRLETSGSANVTMSPFWGTARVIGKLLREDEVANFDGVLHRTRGNLIGAEHEGVQQAREAEHDEYHDDDAQEAAGHLRFLAFGMLTGKHEARYPFDTGGGTTRDSSREFE